MAEILLIEPFFTGSHAAWSRELAAYSRHKVTLLTLEGRHWKWRMHGGAVTLARKFMALEHVPDLILASDMLDLTTFLALTRAKTHGVPAALYMHENQLTYPWSPDDADPAKGRDMHYGFINIASALAADRVFFNSDFHRESFLAEAKRFLARFPDHNEPEAAGELAAKSRTLRLGLELSRFDPFAGEKREGKPLLLWNHRWEYDKNPEGFFRLLYALEEKGVEFEVAVLGERYGKAPAVFEEARQRLGEKIVHFGYAESFADYARWLHRADFLPVTSVQDFFGISIAEALYCDTFPLLPRRLAYPELVPEAHHEEVFYDSEEGAVERLAGMCRNVEAYRQRKTRNWVERFDWRRMAEEYDKALETLLA